MITFTARSIAARAFLARCFLLVLITAAPNASVAVAQKQGVSCTSALPAADPSSTVCVSRVLIQFDGVSDQNFFYVSWLSLQAESGQVKLNGGPTYSDERGQGFAGRSHYVRVDNLKPNTTYQFDIVSGGKTFSNNGKHWSVTVGPAVSGIATPYNIFGRVKNADGSDADGALIYISVRDADNSGSDKRSALLSDVVQVSDGGNFFVINLEEARTVDFDAKYVYNASKDKVVVTAIGPGGTAGKTYTIQALHPPEPPVTFKLGSGGAAAVATATSTIVPPTWTPTTAPTATNTPTPFVTATATWTLVPELPTETPDLETPTRDYVTATPFVEPTLEESSEPDFATPERTEASPTPAAEPAQVAQVEPTSTRIIRAATATPEPSRSLGALFITDTVLVALSLVLFVGAVLLGLAAFFIWKR